RFASLLSPDTRCAGKPLPRAPHPDFRWKGARAPTSFRQWQRRERRGHRGGVRPYPSAALFRGHNERNTQGFGGHRKEAEAGRKEKGAKHEAHVRRRADREASEAIDPRSSCGASRAGAARGRPQPDRLAPRRPHLGEELGAMFAELTSVAAVQRVIEITKNFAEHLLEDEKRSLTTRVNDETSAHPGREEELSLPPAYRKGTPGVRGVA
ncbi:unnamed protein product, partial [Ectocarpus sp. 12 AP-2014]